MQSSKDRKVEFHGGTPNSHRKIIISIKQQKLKQTLIFINFRLFPERLCINNHLHVKHYTKQQRHVSDNHLRSSLSKILFKLESLFDSSTQKNIDVDLKLQILTAIHFSAGMAMNKFLRRSTIIEFLINPQLKMLSRHFTMQKSLAM